MNILLIIVLYKSIFNCRGWSKYLVENTSEVAYIIDVDGKFTYVSPSVKTIFGYDPKYITGKNFLDFVYKDDIQLALNHKIMALNGEHRCFEYRMLTDKCNIIWVRGRIRPIYKGKSICGISGAVSDITDKVSIENMLKKSINEKETLIKEIHHRVKNNLSIISSLILLQTNRMSDSPERLILMDCLSRIKSMALIHEKLYRSKSLSDIDIEDHIRSLVAQLYPLYNIRKINIDFEIDIENIKIDINMAVPVTLILNELIINAIEHAFVGRASGKVCIIFKQDGNFYEMTVQDNGIGFPKNMDIYNTDTLGLQLVTNLAEQLKDDIEISNGNGTKFKLRFPKGNDNND